MRVLVVGQGGREHAIVWKLRQSPHLQEIFCWPGNVGSMLLAKPLDLPKSAGIQDLVQAAKSEKIDLAVIGPEAYLEKGISDALEASGIKVFGPSQKATALESSKAFAKKMMQEAGIPTASFEIVDNRIACEAVSRKVLARDGGVVIKASGLASGKGVFVCKTEEEISLALERLYSQEFEAASQTVVVEEMLYGRECSYFCFLGDGPLKRIGFAVDHKRLLPGDKGPNTGGMGCYTPVQWLPHNAAEMIEERVVEPLLRVLSKHRVTYTGCLYVGVMWSDKGPSVVEFNVRLGDPEAQVLALSSQEDWLPLMAEKVGMKLPQLHSRDTRMARSRCVMGYVLASSAYPYIDQPEKVSSIPFHVVSTHEHDPDVQVFLASARSQLGTSHISTDAGRVMLVAGVGATFLSAKQKAEKKVEEIRKYWPDFKWRPDMGQTAIQYEEAKHNEENRFPIILGSSSPRRKELLTHLGLEFQIMKPETDEVPKEGESAVDYVQRNAFEKFQWIAGRVRKLHANGVIVVSADTIVAIQDLILEKPQSDMHAVEMLKRLSGTWHTVYTALVVGKVSQSLPEDRVVTEMVATNVKLKDLTEDEVNRYVATREPFDKAGGYAAQGLGSFMVERIEGSFSNVVGLPLSELSRILSQDFSVAVFRDRFDVYR